jgi:hypothetical protein
MTKQQRRNDRDRDTEAWRHRARQGFLPLCLCGKQMRIAWQNIFGIALLSCLSFWQAQAQIQIGTIRGVVTDPGGARVAGAQVVLVSLLGQHREAQQTDTKGEFSFFNLPFAHYEVRLAAPGFQPLTQACPVHSNLPVQLHLQLGLAVASETARVSAVQGLLDPTSASTATTLAENFIRRMPGATRSLNVQKLIATTPGWTTQNNGLLHVRGVDDGVLYVIDGIPIVDRLDAVSASNFDTEMIGALNVLTGNLPAEFGGRSGAVVQIQPRSGIDESLTGGAALSSGSFRAGELDANVGGSFRRKYGFFVTASTARSDRFLDPVDLGNFHNRGGTGKFNQRSDWHPSAKDILLFNLAFNGTDFRVPNREEQEEAGQRQRQELRDNTQSLSWQRAWAPDTVSNLAYFRRSYQAHLFGSEHDTPLFAEQERRHVRQGIVANLTHAWRSHTLKAGLEAARVTPREFFTFAITDEEEAEENEISAAALRFTRDNPFVFRDQRTGTTASWFVQDAFSPLRNLTLNAGLRYDRSSLLVTEQQFSPRLGAVYHFPQTRTALRASFNRLFMPPQVENLLLADSEQARALSPFATTSEGGALIKPERVSAYEAGVAQDVRGWFKLDVAYWHRHFRNFDDPNVFFNTTIIFPNSVASGFARGLDVRLDVPQRRGWSGYVSYTNARIQQTGPINGGLFLTDEFLEIGPGTRFTPDHDQRNVGAFGLMYSRNWKGRGEWWVDLAGRHESGVPLEVEPERLAELREMRGAELVNFERRRVRPWTVFDISTGFDWLRSERATLTLQFDLQNLANHQFAYNFGNPFEGTHFGYPRLMSARLKLQIR